MTEAETLFYSWLQNDRSIKGWKKLTLDFQGKKEHLHRLNRLLNEEETLFDKIPAPPIVLYAYLVNAGHPRFQKDIDVIRAFLNLYKGDLISAIKPPPSRLSKDAQRAVFLISDPAFLKIFGGEIKNHINHLFTKDRELLKNAPIAQIKRTEENRARILRFIDEKVNSRAELAENFKSSSQIQRPSPSSQTSRQNKCRASN